MEIKTEIETIKSQLSVYGNGLYFQAYAAIEFLESEFETLRASSTIKQANIERLEAENEQLEDKIQEQLCTVGSLLEENAKLIAERDDLIHDRDMLKMCADQYEDELKRMHAERDQLEKLHTAVVDECIRAGFPFDESNPFMLVEKLIDFWAKRALKAERDEYENHNVYATLYEDAKALIDPHTKASGGELPTSVIQSFEYLFKFWLEHKAEREAMMKQEPVYQYHNSGNSWCDCNKNVYDAMKDEYRRIVYISPPPAQQIPKTIDNFNSIDVDGYDNIMQCKNCSYRYNEQADADERENSGRRQHNCTDNNLVQQIPEITLPTHAPLIEEALVEYFGRKCPDYDADCKCCQAWSQFEGLPAQQINPKVEAYLFKCRKGGERMEYVCVDPDNTQYKRDKHELIEVLPLGVIEPAQQDNFIHQQIAKSAEETKDWPEWRKNAAKETPDDVKIPERQGSNRIFEEWWRSQSSYKASEKEPSRKAFLVGFNLSQVYRSPLPAQQIPEGYADKRKDSLLEYLKLQRRKLNSHYETRLKIVPSMEKEPWLSNIKKWDDWIAEREAMLKQSPVGVVIETTDAINIAIEQNGATGLQSMKAGDYVYRSPLPAQQIPEGYADKRKDSLLEYLKLQRRKLNSHYETRLKIVPSMEKEPWLSNIKKWDDWIAEREAMLKQSPVGVVIETTDAINIAIEQNGATGLQSMKAGDYVYRSPLPAQQEPNKETIERWLNEFAIWFFNTKPASLSSYSRKDGRWIADCVNDRWLSYLADRKELYRKLAQQVAVPKGCAESEFEKYFQEIGEGAWEDHPVSQVYIDGFNRAVQLLSASQPKGELI